MKSVIVHWTNQECLPYVVDLAQFRYLGQDSAEPWYRHTVTPAFTNKANVAYSLQRWITDLHITLATATRSLYVHDV